MSENTIKNIMDTTLEKLKGMINADIITGNPIEINGITLIPVSKVAYGVATGGSDFVAKSSSQVFGGGGGAGVTVSPIAFIVNMAPEIIDKAKELFKSEPINIPE